MIAYRVFLPILPAPLTGSYNSFYFRRPSDSHPTNRRRVMTFKIKCSRCRSALNALQIAFTVSGSYGRLPAYDFVDIITLPPADDDIAWIISRPHAVAFDLQRDGVGSNGKRRLDFIKCFGRNLFKLQLDFGASSNSPYDGYQIAMCLFPDTFKQPSCCCL